MSSGSKQRNKQQRIDNLGIEKSRWSAWWQNSDKTDAALRGVIAAVAGVTLLAVCLTWRPPFAFREGGVPPRDLISRADFEVPDEAATEEVRDERRREIVAFYRKRVGPLDQLRARLKDQLFLAMSSDNLDELSPDGLEALQNFQIPADFQSPDETQTLSTDERFEALRDLFGRDAELQRLDAAVQVAMRNQYENGIIQSLQHKPAQGNQTVIRVYPETNPAVTPVYVEVQKVRIAEAIPQIRKLLKENLRQSFADEKFDYATASDLITGFIVTRLPDFQTLVFDAARTREAADIEAAKIPPVMVAYQRGESVLAEGGRPLGESDLFLLRREWETIVSQMRLRDRFLRVGAYAGMLMALYLLCGAYIYFVGDRRLIDQPLQLIRMLAVMVVVVMAGFWLSGRGWRAELVPLTVGAIISSVVYRRELGMLLMAAACLAMTLFIGADVSELVVMLAACISIVLLLGRIRTRSRLLTVGSASALVTIATVIGVGIVTGQSLSGGSVDSGVEPMVRGPIFDTVLWSLLSEATLGGLAIVGTAAAMTPFLPLIERAFDVQTDLKLLELGDVSHPLLRRLAQRAPGTYNHSIAVASIAEAAADEIGANGLLVRVGSYFHDIGKMFKPEYFIENQLTGRNQHDSLQPAMSTLVIIAHVKDGADLARSHNLPEPIIDLIMQHHGTTLVEFFFREAAKRSEENPNREDINDRDFRYPGPKPQTLEAAVMMLADTVESASRTLVDPTPARIRHLVDSIAEKKVADGQFDECGLTFRQLNRIRNSLVKSLTAIYHARVKYPGQKSDPPAAAKSGKPETIAASPPRAESA